MEENELLQNEFEWNSADILDTIANGASGRDPDYPNRPNTGAGDMHTLDAEGNYVDPNKPGAENVSAAYAQWVEEAADYGVENLSTRDQILYAQAAYRLGSISAEEAQTIYDPAFEQHMQDSGFEFDEERGQWKDDGRLDDRLGGASGARDWYTPIDFSETSSGFEDFDGTWITSEWDVDREVIKNSWSDKYFKSALAIGAGLITGGAASGLMGGMSGWMSGAIKGAIGSATSQGVMGGKIDPQSLLQSVLMGGLGGIVGDLADMDASIFDDATGLTGAADDMVTGLSDMLKIPYDEALKIAEGVSAGLITGDDLSSIVANAAGSYTQGEIMDALQAAYGDEVQVSDWFKDGESNIPVDALEPLLEGAIQGAINGGVDEEDLFGMLWDYHSAGGDLDFMLPALPELAGEGGILPKWLADISIDKGSDWTYTENEDGSVNMTWDEDIIPDVSLPDVNLPDVNLPDVSLPDIPEIKCPTGEKWSSNLSKCIPDVDLPDVNLPDVNLPDVNLPDVNLPDVTLPDVNLPDVPEIKCPAGEKWSSNLSKCVPEVELPEVDVEVPEIKCPTGEKWSSDLSECVPDLPDVPSIGGGGGSGYEATPQGLFSYTTLTPYEKKAIEPIVDYVAKAKGMLS